MAASSDAADREAKIKLLGRIEEEITSRAEGARFTVRNRSADEVIAEVSDQGSPDALDAISRAKAAFPLP